MIKAVIFDLNGVFLQSEYLSDRVGKRYGIDPQEFLRSLQKVLAKARKPGVKDSFSLWQPHLKRLGLEISKKAFFDFWFKGEKLLPELIEYARKLKGAGLMVFILSNNFKERAEYYRKNFPEIFETASHVYFSWETGFVKPNPKAFKNVLKKNGLKPEECIYFDDSDSNIAMAQKLGFHAQKYQGLGKTKKFVKGLIGSKD